MEGVGSRALRVRSVRLALERREAILSGEGGGWEFNCERREVRVEIDADMMEIVDLLGFKQTSMILSSIFEAEKLRDQSALW